MAEGRSNQAIADRRVLAVLAYLGSGPGGAARGLG